MVRLSFLILIISVFSIISCEFFMASPFPDFLPSVRRVENLDTYFDSSNKQEYDMFVMDDGTGIDLVFILYRTPDVYGRKVVVVDDNLNFITEDFGYTTDPIPANNRYLGSLHTRQPFLPAIAGMVVGQRRLILPGPPYNWTSVDVDETRKDFIMVYNDDSTSFFSLDVVNGAQSTVTWEEYDDNPFDPIGVPSSFILDNTGDEYFLENAAFNNNNTPGIPGDDVVILFLSRSDDEGFALMIPASAFPGAVDEPAMTFGDPNYVHYFGKIKRGSVHVMFDGFRVMLTQYDGRIVTYNYEYNNGYHWDRETNGKQFKDKIVAYAPYKPGYYVFDPATKDIFKCTSWWE